MADPWLKFYTADWRSDPRLKMCSAAARGVWIEMICLMHEAMPYGHLLIHGQSPNEAQLASLTGIPHVELPDLIAELERMGVFSRTKEGVIYSRKLVRMASRSAKARKNGKKGGNPSLSKDEEKTSSVNLRNKGEDKPQKPEARSQIEGGGGSAHAQIARASPDHTLRERILAACGADTVSGLTGPGGGVIGTRTDMQAVEAWQRDLGLDDEVILAVVRDTMSRKRDGPPARLSYFDRPMQREAGNRSRAPLTPIDGGQDVQSPNNRREAAARDSLGRIVDAAVRNRAPSRGDCGFG